MALKSRMLGSGIAAQAARNICGEPVSALPAGTSGGNATVMPGAVVALSTTPSSTGLIIAPEMSPGDSIVIANNGGNTVTIYPPAGSSAKFNNAQSTFTIATVKRAIIYMQTGTQFFTILTA